MAPQHPHGHGFDEDGDAAAGSSWWRALMASHVFRSVLAVAVVIAGIAVYAVSVSH